MLYDVLLDLTERSDRVPPAQRGAVVLLALVSVVAVDVAAPSGLLLTLPYALCVMAAAWFVSHDWGLLAAAVAALAAFAVGASSRDGETWAIVIANAALLALLFVSLALLTAAVRRGIDELVDSSRVDAMTGVLSRRGFLDALTTARRRAVRRATPIGVVYLDLDGLKQVNDEQGHAAGDALIRRFTDRVSRHLRASDAFGRLGGDEFAIVVERADAQIIEAVVGRVLDDPGLPDVSCGVRLFDGDYPPPAAMLAGADRRMYANKQFRRGGLPPRRAG
ncbi:MAG: GGDEF domain-containing protein [Ilumatobacter sp.]|uniref:GGDEF domain-containing protein n=1 Tax=Ilumatobacter sp. TaxID=1967498 RepID=UPI0026169EFF|nr:GGDEF domain-containing protein [Ilumatobacter sp.]MDJ0767774.1 GGDEF domain-containing protein [Ilumatobacter sp.]